MFDRNGIRQKIAPSKHSYITAYLKGWLHRDCCYDCKFTGIPRVADCTIGDFWGIIDGKVQFSGDKSCGVSVILSNNDKGRKLLELIRDRTYLESKTIEDAIIDNHNIITPDRRPEQRDYIYDDLINLESSEFIKKYKLHLPIPSRLFLIKKSIYKVYKRIFK